MCVCVYVQAIKKLSQISLILQALVITKNHLQEFQELTPVKDQRVDFNVINKHYFPQLIKNFH